LNDHIEAIPAIELHSFVFNRQCHLALKSEASQVKFAAQTLFVGRFKKARSKGAMYFDGSSNNLLRKIRMKKFAACLRVYVVNHV